MTEVTLLHNKAMEFVDLASLAKQVGEHARAEEYMRCACDNEAKAARALPLGAEYEPSRSILFRSAATLAITCGLVEAAASLVREGLRGAPPSSVEAELRNLIDSSQQTPTEKSTGIQDFLENAGWTLSHSTRLPSREAMFVPSASLRLSTATLRYCNSEFPNGLYSHQAVALTRFLDGNNVCLATGTASGKSMVFYAALMEFLATNLQSRVLLVYPLKALAREQEARLERAILSAGHSYPIGRIDGQVPSVQRPAIVRRSRILILTPDIIHAWLLASVSDADVAGFLRHLGLAIVDEIHSYTGVFGSNSAFLFRRLQHVVNILGGGLSFLCASATIADPDGQLQGLLGRKFSIIGPEFDSSARYPVDVLMVRPPKVRDLLSETTDLFKYLSSSDRHRFIAFVDSRKQVEYMSAILRRDEPESNDFWDDHLDRMQVLPFRSGYELDDRNKIQDRLSDGNVKGVISTSALELGIDIPHLDTGVLLGVPLSSTSLLQRIGRIGRHRPGTVLIINRGELQDEQAFRNPETLLSRPLSESSLYLENQRIQYLNALCLARNGGEHDGTVGNGAHGETSFHSFIDWPAGFLDLCRKERIGEIPPDLQSMKMEAGDDPNHVFPLRDIESQFQVEVKQGPDQRSLGSLSHGQVLREAYPGAIYYYTGQPFRVYRVFQQDKKIQTRREAHYTTKPISLPNLVFPNLSPGNVHSSFRLGELVVAECNLQIRQIIVGYKERRGPNETNINYPLSFQDGGIRYDLPRFTRNYFTTGVILTHPVLSMPGVKGEVCADLLYEAFLSIIPFERQDVGASFDKHRTDRKWVHNGQMFLALHDQTYGSLRLSGRILDNNCLSEVLARLREFVQTSGTNKSEPLTSAALERLSIAAESPQEAISFDYEVPAANGEKLRVIMPGSRGINLRRNNEEFEVTGVFFSPKLQSVAYRGRHLGTTNEEVVEIVAIETIKPTAGESMIADYDPETGDVQQVGLLG